MELPTHIAEQIRAIVKEGSPLNHSMDSEAREHGAIALMRVEGSLWLLRPDGSFWDVDAEWEKPLHPLHPGLHLTAIVAGVERYPWLAELLPSRVDDAIDCPTCEGTGRVHEAFCPICGGVAWLHG